MTSNFARSLIYQGDPDYIGWDDPAQELEYMMTTATVRVEIPVEAAEALRDALGFGAHLWDAESIANRLLKSGYVIRKVEELPRP